VFRRAMAPEPPIEVLLGGQPGAGKTRATALVAKELYPDAGVTPIVGDDFRQFHPDYRRTLREDPLRTPEVTAAAVGRWVQMSVEHAVEHRFPVLVEGTWRNAGVPLRAAEMAQGAGYTPAGSCGSAARRWNPATTPSTSATTVSTARSRPMVRSDRHASRKSAS